MDVIESGEFTWRDVAIATEYLQQVSDLFEEMIDNPPTIVGSSLDAVADATLEKVDG